MNSVLFSAACRLYVRCKLNQNGIARSCYASNVRVLKRIRHLALGPAMSLRSMILGKAIVNAEAIEGGGEDASFEKKQR